MCGIFCSFGTTENKQFSLDHRGPDSTKTKILGKCSMTFYRLSINDTSDNGMQPFERNGKMLMCNGEIYNHKEFPFENPKSQSDCECLIPAIEEHGGLHQVADKIRGVFAMCYTDGETVWAARDPIGVRPLFYSRLEDGGIQFGSEVKAFDKLLEVQIFPPGHTFDSQTMEFKKYYDLSWKNQPVIKNPYEKIRKSFIEAVYRRISNTDRKVCFLLSGGLDSSLVAAVGKMFLGQKIKTFSIGTKDSPDCKAARVMAKYLDSDHTEVEFTTEKGIEALPKVIKSLESYDTTTIRASVPMWLLGQYISQNTDYRVVISGEGSDELFGGYLYFHYAPSVDDFVDENIRRLKLLHQFDVLRSDRCMAAHGLEVRVPFLDRDFIDVGMTIDQSLKFQKGQIEKHVLRKAFEGYLPDEILWRQKDAFSDAVGYSWVEEIKKYSENVEIHADFSELEHNPPSTNEEKMYRQFFWENYLTYRDNLISEIWRPKWTEQSDPSAKYLNVHLKK
jgi:asparagine synthase (glutamine-hydrolysing)